MFGLLTTLQVGVGSQLVPVACPIAFVPLDQMDGIEPGIIAPDNPAFPLCRAVLDKAVQDDFCRLRQ